MNVKIHDSWKSILKNYFESDDFIKLVEFIKKEYGDKNKIIYPPGKLIFNAFNITSFDIVKVVILGQDPYPNPGQAMGLAFSVPNNVLLPPSLKNIFCELENDLGIRRTHGDLSDWASQGVLLLNTVLTVIKGQPGSHRGVGWESFTDFVIKSLSDNKDHVVFVLWGNDASKKIKLIDIKKHAIISTAHPSPLSANRGFLGSKPFSKINNILINWGYKPIIW